jgi:hypothetical protein
LRTSGPATFGPADETADTDKKDGADEQQQHQCRTEGSQSVYIRVIRGKKYDSLILRGESL